MKVTWPLVSCDVCGDALTIADSGSVCRQCSLSGVVPRRPPVSRRGIPDRREPYQRPVPRCPECGGPTDTGAGHDCEV